MKKLTNSYFWKRFIPKLKAPALTLALIVAVILQGRGDTITSIKKGNYNSGATWSGGIVPKPTDDVVIATNVTIVINTSEICHNLTINEGETLNINNYSNDYTKLTVNGTLTIVGNGTIVSDTNPIVYGTTKALVYSGTKAKTTGFEWPTKSGPTDVSINNSGGVTISGPRTVSNLTINPTGAATINSGLSITINTALLIESSSAGTGSLIIGDRPLKGTGTKSVQRYIPSSGWHIVSSPVSGQQLGSFVTNNSIAKDATANDYDLAPYNTTDDAWTPYTIAGDTLTFGVGQGYVLRRSTEGTVTFSGTINSGLISFSNFVTDGFGWNALGNPYTSAIYAKGEGSILNALISRGILPSANQALYVWDESANDYYTISNNNFGAFPNDDGETLPDLDQAFIAAGQGFIVKAAANKIVYFKPEMQVSQPTTPLKSAKAPGPAIRLSVRAGDMINQTMVAFGKDMTNGLDPSYDAGKLKGNPDLALYTRLVDGSSSVDFAVQALPDISFNEVRIPVGLDFPAGGEVTFSLEVSTGFPTEAEVYLEDTQTQTLTKLNVENAKCTATIAAGTAGSGRFNLLITKYTATGINSPVAENTFKVFNLDNTIYINGPANPEITFTLYSINGKIWTSRRAENLSQNRIDVSGIPAGIYLLNIKQNSISQTEKLVLMN